MENKKEQTAVESLLKKLDEKSVSVAICGVSRINITINGTDYSNIRKEAKQKEKERIKNAYLEGQQNWDSEQTFEHYYNEKFSK